MNKGIKCIEERIIRLVVDSVEHAKVLVFDLF